MTRIFQLTLGPVQGFVTQARRTRDFWAGSFILSLLGGVAQRTTQQLHGDILFPKSDGHLFQWMNGKGTGKEPGQGSLPNCFTATVPDDFQPEQVVHAIQTAWIALAECVWTSDLAAAPDQTRVIWDRQIISFWEIRWVFAENEIDYPLGRRKLWRTHLRPQEPGARCNVMDGFQELSGSDHPVDKNLQAFWSDLREKGSGLATDLREGEQLCVIAFVKRRFARFFANLKVDLPGWTLHGWKLPYAVPSVVTMAALPWLFQVISTSQSETLQACLESARKLQAYLPEYDTTHQISGLDRVVDHSKTARRFAALDGNFFFSSSLENRRLFTNWTPRLAADVGRQFALLRRQTETSEPSPFYAILLMDGDRLGQHLRYPKNRQPIAKALQQFTREAARIVDEHDGFLIYAGGDDLLAILPLDRALRCAAAQRVAYTQAFAQAEIGATISAAVLFAHIRKPLGAVLGQAHHLLDKVAKDQTGRDAIAVRVLKPGCQALEWAQPWSVALDPESGKVGVDQLAVAFRDEESDQAPFSSRFFFKIRQRFELLSPKTEEPVFDDEEQQVAVLAAEYLASSANRDSARDLDFTKHGPEHKLDRAKRTIRPLLKQCRPHRAGQQQASTLLEADGALLVRFLATGGFRE